jgi:hypothetical protein
VSLSWVQICSNLAIVTIDNCCQFLEVADMINAPNLLEEAVSVIINNLSEIITSPHYISMKQTNPTCLQSIFNRIQEIKSLEMIYVSFLSFSLFVKSKFSWILLIARNKYLKLKRKTQTRTKIATCLVITSPGSFCSFLFVSRSSFLHL